MTDIARTGERPLTETELLMLLKAERDQTLRARSLPEYPTTGIKWVVGGTVLVFAMLICFAWAMFVEVKSVLEKSAERSHELAMKAVEAAKVSQPADPSLALPIILGLAAFFIVFGIILKIWR